MKNLLYILCVVVLSGNLISCRTFLQKDDISIIAGSLIDSLRLCPDFILTQCQPRIQDTTAFEKLYKYNLPEITNYLVFNENDNEDDEAEEDIDDEDDEESDYLDYYIDVDENDKIQPKLLADFEKDFHIQYIFNDELLPPYFQVNNSNSSIPLRTDLESGSYPDKNISSRIFTSTEISIVPELHNNYLRLNIIYGTLYWNKELKSYRNMYFGYAADGKVYLHRYSCKRWLLEYSPKGGWKRATDVEWDSLWTNEIPILCMESAKVSAAQLAKDENIDSAFIDWRYNVRYVADERENNLDVLPDYSLDMPEVRLKYLRFSSDSKYFDKHQNSEALKNGDYFLRPKYRLDGDRFYVEVEVYFAKVDDDRHLTYDLRNTDHYTYQLDSDNRWQPADRH